jgi:hypothetical protein
MKINTKQIKLLIREEIRSVLYEQELEEAFGSSLALLMAMTTSPAQAGVEGYSDFTVDVAEAYSQIKYEKAVDNRDTDEALKYGKALEDLRIVSSTPTKEKFGNLNVKAQAMLSAANDMVISATDNKDEEKLLWLQDLVERGLTVKVRKK